MSGSLNKMKNCEGGGQDSDGSKDSRIAGIVRIVRIVVERGYGTYGGYKRAYLKEWIHKCELGSVRYLRSYERTYLKEWIQKCELG